MSGRVHDVPGWALGSAAAAPVALIGGWTLAASRQPAHYSAVRETISALAAHGATDRWIMTAGLAALGGCHAVTALGLRPAQGSGRWLLATGGLATVLVAAAPQPEHGSSPLHLGAAAVGFATLSLWPVFAAGSTRPAVLRRRWGLMVTALLLALLAWLGLELGGGELVGLSERALAASQALWPLVVVLALRARDGGIVR
ncbi:MAG: DUF998 domain-containing protein [Jatrophihabitantaceae bacterium]